MNEKSYNELKQKSRNALKKTSKAVLIDHIFNLYKIIQYGYRVRRGMKFYFILSILLNIGLTVYILWN